MIKEPRQFLIALAAVCAVTLTGTSHAAAGRTAGSFSVDNFGAANYSIPIWAPRGPNGLQPNISLSYNSNQSNGYVGTGWVVSGISSITRCNRTVAQDGQASGVTLATTDAFCLDGQRLQWTGGNASGTAGSTYQTEIANFEIVTAYNSAGNGPGYFVVQAPNGTQYEYGNPASGSNAQVLATTTTTALSWMLDKVTDAAGNTMIFTYSPAVTGNGNGTTPTLTGITVPVSISWTPTSYGSASYQYKMAFNYSPAPNALQSSISAFVDGTAVTNTELLSSIAVTATLSGTTSTVKQYTLNYTASIPTQRDLLTGVAECADQTLSNCLLPSSFTYQTTTPTVSTGSTTVANATFGPIAVYDFNGDGIKDLLFQSGTTWYVAFGTSTGYSAPVSTGIVTTQLSMASFQSITYAGLLVGDVLGTHHDGILAMIANGSGGYTYQYYSWTGSAFTSVNTGFLAPGCGAGSYNWLVALANIRGNGLPDLVTMCQSGYYTRIFYTNQNTSANGVPSFSPTAVTAFTDTASVQLATGWGLAAAGTFTGGELRVWDFDGDGREDIFYSRSAYGCIYACNSPDPISGYMNATFEMLGQSDGTFNAVSVNFINAEPAAGSGMQFVNWNDDKCTDITIGALVYVSACNGAAASQVTLAGSLLAALDIDGDGRTDAVILNPTTGNVGVQFSQGSTVSSTVTDLGIPAVSAAYYGRVDIGGAGLDNLACFDCTANALTYYARSSPGTTPDVLLSATDGFGNSVQPSYVTLYQTQNSHYTATNPAPPESTDAMDTSPLNVVDSVLFSDPSATGATYTQTHYYTDGWENLTGRGFLGFTTHQVIDSRNAVSETLSYNMVFPNTGLLIGDIAVQSNGGGATISSMTATPATESAETLNSTLGTQRYFPYIVSQSVSQYDAGGTKNANTITTYGAPDPYGNFLSISSTITDEDNNSLTSGQTWTTATSNTYAPPTSPYWCVSLPTQTQVTQSSSIGATVTQTTQFTPDLPSTCREHIITHAAQSGSNYNVTETLWYDSFGNITSDQTAGAGISRTATATWGPTGQFPVNVTDPSGAETQYGYNLSYGTISSVKDPNNLTTSWAYTDGFGRRNQETRPDGTYTTYTYQDCASLGACLIGAHALYVQAQVYGANQSLQSTHTVYDDPVGRALVQTDPMLTGAYARNEVRYDSFGNVLQQAAPCLWSSLTAGCSYWTVSSYDILNRRLTSQHPRNATDNTPEITHYNYAGWTTSITDPNNNTKTLITDPNGWLRETMDGSGYGVLFAYDAAGNKTVVTDTVGSMLWTGSYTYGVKAFLNAETDLNRGAWLYTPDALGERLNWTDPKGQNFSEQYDALSRPYTRSEPDLFTQWTWGSTPAIDNVGKLAAVCTGVSAAAGTPPTACTSDPQSVPGYSESKTFDSFGRLLNRAIQIPGDTTYTYSFAYDPNTGLLSTMTYPTTPAGQPLQLQYGYASGILQSVTDITPPSVTLWTANAQNQFGQVTQETLGNQVQVNHAFDAATAMLTSISAGKNGGTALQNESFLFDAIGNLTERADNTLGFREDIYLDAANRLDHTKINGNLDMQMTYNPNGSINSRQFSAGPSNTDEYTSPNSMVEESSNAGAGGAVTWTSFNQPSTISGASGTSSAFFYGPNHQRWQQQAYYSGSAETTTYIGGGLEKIATPSGTVYRHFVPVGNNLVVYLPGSAPTIQYVTGDHVGSTATITDTNGNLVLAESFSPWGVRRSPADWTLRQTATDAALLTSTMRQGFTGHEHVDNLDLIDMNGRMYQGTGMMSPDPHISDPTNPQGYNRYSYVNSNPLTFLDPSGFFTIPCFPWLRAAGVAVTNVPDSDAGENISADNAAYSESGSNLVYSTRCQPVAEPSDLSGPVFFPPTITLVTPDITDLEVPCLTGTCIEPPQTQAPTLCEQATSAYENMKKEGPSVVDAAGNALAVTEFSADQTVNLNAQNLAPSTIWALSLGA